LKFSFDAGNSELHHTEPFHFFGLGLVSRWIFRRLKFGLRPKISQKV